MEPDVSADTDKVQYACTACGGVNRFPRARVGDDPTCGRCKAKLFPRAPVVATDGSWKREVEDSPIPVLVDFWAPWCGPCKMIAPLLDEIATEKAGTVKVAKVNVDDNQSLSVKYNVRAIPALLFFKNGQLRDQVVGMTTRKDLLGRLDALA